MHERPFFLSVKTLSPNRNRKIHNCCNELNKIFLPETIDQSVSIWLNDLAFMCNDISITTIHFFKFFIFFKKKEGGDFLYLIYQRCQDSSNIHVKHLQYFCSMN